MTDSSARPAIPSTIAGPAQPPRGARAGARRPLRPGSGDRTGHHLDAVKQQFLTQGYAFVPGAIDTGLVADIRDSIRDVIRYVLRREGIAHDPQGDLDSLYNTLCVADRALGARAFDQVRTLPDTYRLAHEAGLRAIATHVLGSTLLTVPFEKFQLRADRPDEGWSLLDWHQDYTYNMVSHPTITFWTSLTATTLDMGPVDVVPGSHAAPLPTELQQRVNLQGRKGVKPVILSDERESWDVRAVRFETVPGDVVLIHQFVVHRSGRNRSDRNRWSFQVRYGHLDNDSYYDRGWTYEKGGNFDLFEKHHGELLFRQPSD